MQSNRLLAHVPPKLMRQCFASFAAIKKSYDATKFPDTFQVNSKSLHHLQPNRNLFYSSVNGIVLVLLRAIALLYGLR